MQFLAEHDVRFLPLGRRNLPQNAKSSLISVHLHFKPLTSLFELRSSKHYSAFRHIYVQVHLCRWIDHTLNKTICFIHIVSGKLSSTDNILLLCTYANSKITTNNQQIKLSKEHSIAWVESGVISGRLRPMVNEVKLFSWLQQESRWV